MRMIDADALSEIYCAIHCPDYDLCNLPDNPCEAIDIIACQPTIDPVKHGHWIDKEEFVDEYSYECSECRERFSYPDYCIADDDYYNHLKSQRFCPNCGARMDGESHD